MWARVSGALQSTTSRRLPISALTAELTRPPFGIKEGLLPLLWITLLVSRAEDIAPYEHGSLVLSIDDAVAERLVKNPGNFTFKYLAASSGVRHQYLETLSKALGGSVSDSVGLMVSAHIRTSSKFRYTLSTTQLSTAATAVRSAILEAREPDELVFVLLPEAVGAKSVLVNAPLTKRTLEVTAEKIAAAIRELKDAYPSLIDRVANSLRNATSTRGDLSQIRKLVTAQCTNLAGRVLDNRLQALIFAATRETGSDAEWLENVAMVVAGGKNPRTWTDEQELGFALPMEDLGGALRRTSALLFEHLARNSEGSFEARRVTVTAPDGSEVVSVVSLPTEQQEVVAKAAENLTQQLADALNLSMDQACQTLLAWLAVGQNPTEATGSKPSGFIEHKRKGAR